MLPASLDSQKLVVENDPLAVAVAKRLFHFCKHGISEEDIAQIARIGLIRASRKFDPSKVSPYTGKPIAFSSYAVPFIRGEVMHFMRDRAGAVKVPRKYREQLAIVTKKAAATGRSRREVAAELGFDWEMLHEIEELHIVVPPQEFLEESIAAEDPQEVPSDRVVQLLSKLPWRQSNILLKHFYGNESPEKIAIALGIELKESTKKLPLNSLRASTQDLVTC